MKGLNPTMNKNKDFNCIKASDLLRFDMSPFLLGVLFSRVKVVDEKYFCGYTSFKISKH